MGKAIKKKNYTGFAVVTEDFSATIFSDYSLETCKRYCRKGYIIVRTYNKRAGYEFRICWTKWYQPFEFRLGWREFNLLWLHVNWNRIYNTKYENEVFWKPE